MRWRGAVVACALFAASWAFLATGIRVGIRSGDRPGFHIDEAHKLSEAYYFDLFRHGDFDHPDWSEDFYARTNPPVAKYIFGIALLAVGKPVRDRSLQTEFERLWMMPPALRGRVADAPLRATRHVSALFGALACAALCALAYRAAGIGAAILTAVFVLGNETFAQTARQGLTDTVLLFHLALIGPVSIVATDALARWWRSGSGEEPRPRRAVLFVSTVLLPGATIALAAGSKLNGALAAPIYAFACLLTAWREPGPGHPLRRRLGMVLAILGLTALVALVGFVGMNPYLHPAPFGRMLGTLRVFDDWMISQQIHPGEGLFSPSDRMRAVGDVLLRRTSAPLVRWLGAVGAWLFVLGTLLGITRLSVRTIALASGGEQGGTRAERARRRSAIVALVWSLVCLVAVTVWLRLNWGRYYLPPILAASFLAAIGIARLPRLIWSIAALVRRRPTRAATGRVVAEAFALPLAAGLLLASGILLGPDLRISSKIWRHPERVPPRADFARFRRGLSVGLMRLGNLAGAQEQLERALTLVGPDPGDRSPKAVQRCVLLNEVAVMRYRLGRRAEAIAALEEHVALLERFRDRMVSSDPYVRGSGEGLIEKRKSDLARMRGGT